MDKVLMKTDYISRGPFLPEMRPSGPISNYDYIMELYNDAGLRNRKEMNMTDMKDDSAEGSDDGEERLVIADSGDTEHSSEDSNSIDSDYVYTLDATGTVASGTNQENTDVPDKEVKNNQNNQTDCDDLKDKIVDAGYVYVMDPDTCGREAQVKKEHVNGQIHNHDNVTDKPLDFSHDTQKGQDLTKSSQSVLVHKPQVSLKTSVLNDSPTQTKEQTDCVTGTVKLTGASKRKRKFSLENTISHLMKAKCIKQEDTGVGEDCHHSQTVTTESAIKQETVFSQSNGLDLSVQSRTTDRVEQTTTACVQNGQRDSSPENDNTSIKTNRRKSSFVSRCVNNIESEMQASPQQNVNKLKANTHDQPLDFSFSKNTEVKPTISTPKNVKKEEPGVIDLSVKKSKSNTTFTPHNSIKQAKTDAPNLPVKGESVDWMKKYSSQYMNQNMMSNVLQLQMWMQAAAMNNAVGNGTPSQLDKPLKNDVNKNVVMRDLLTAPAFPDIAAANMSMLIANQMANSPITNGTAPYLDKIKNKAAKVMEKERQYRRHKQDSNDDFDLPKPDGAGITNWTASIDDQTMGKVFLTNFKEEKDGEPVKFFVRDNEQVQAILKVLVDLGTLTAGQIPLDRDQMRYMCSICNQRFFHVEHLSKHIKKKHILKKYMCNVCDRSFHDAGNFRQHMRVHDANDVPYECPECQRRFRHKCTLKVHMRIHTGEKPFKCEICHASFKISSGLQTHMRKHTGETPYACEYCNLRFKCQSNLKQHLFQHTQARPFPCDVCGKNYSRKSIRDSHRQTHFKGSPESLQNKEILMDSTAEQV